MEIKKRVLIFYDHFYPAYKAGGPVQSLVNLIRNLSAEFDFYIVCKPHEMGETTVLSNIEINKWTSWENKASVMYWNYSFSKRNELKKLIADVQPTIVFINGLYSFYFSILPLWYASKNKGSKIILSARGMLHPGALAQKATKKKGFLFLLKFSGIQKKICWHATDEKEKEFIQNKIGTQAEIIIAGNFANTLQPLPLLNKESGQLILGTIALISPMKNHKAIAEALLNCTVSITWHIYGGIKDEEYWNECKVLIQKMPLNVKVIYHGMLAPTELQKALDSIQVFIMPSESENFGHAIAEALSAGKPVITTNTTPFVQLTNEKAGVVVAIDQLADQLPAAIQKFVAMDSTEYEQYSSNATKFINKFISVENLHQQYNTLFNV